VIRQLIAYAIIALAFGGVALLLLRGKRRRPVRQERFDITPDDKAG
jgi:hypothetical protein